MDYLREPITESDFDAGGALVKVAGLSDRDEMLFVYSFSHCGHIRDGISISIPGGQYGWVMSFEDLEKVYLGAKKFNEQGKWVETSDGGIRAELHA